ncbi:double-CXXCG motif protein [Myxococcus hansupus]|uniref:SitI6 family double-CXXCG motif immunity protein n=1 Tax=Pseudomyxococcus hansupus TaxID=1297742 RepID=UPI0002F10DB8|nr:double-CXXCG motif protein [Myxococcus hansupus]
MTRYYWLVEDKAATARHAGDINAAHRWKLPGLASCPGCGATWAGAGHYYPAVDLSALPEQASFLKARPEPFSEYARLRELVRPLAPPHVPLPPGTRFGPLEGTARGDLGPFTWIGNALLLMRQDALEQLQMKDVYGFIGGWASLRFRQKSPPAYFEPQLQPHGRLHPDCLPRDATPPCGTCGWVDLSRPEEPVLDATAIPPNLDIFRLGNFATMIVSTERFMNAVLQSKLKGIRFLELAMR